MRHFMTISQYLGAKIQIIIEIIHNIAHFFNKTSNFTNQIDIKYTRYYTITLLHKEN